MRCTCCFALLPLVLAACAEPPAAELESVERIVLELAHQAEGVELGDEARPASVGDAAALVQLCLPEVPASAARRLVLPIAAKHGRPRATLEFRGASATSDALGDEGWSQLALELEAGAVGCARLAIAGGSSTAWLSDALVITPGRPRPWVIVYVVDSLRYDRTPFALEAETEGARLAPAFEALARDGLVYERAFTSSSWTRPAVASILTGVGPSAHRVLDRQDRLPPWVPRLPQVFAEAGWHTVAVSTNPNILPVFGFLDGFDRFLDVSSDSWLSERGYERLGATLLDVARASADLPLFLYVHDNEPHAPYRPLEKYRAMFDAAPEGSPAEIPGEKAGAALLSQAVQLQRATIRSTSDRFGALMDELRALGRYDDAVVILTADHGEEFGEHGGTGHGRTLFQEQLHVPLVVKPPLGRLAPGRVSLPVSLESVAGAALELAGLTALELARLAASWPGAAGRSLLQDPPADKRSFPVLIAELDLAGATAQSALRWPWKLLRESEAPPQLFDLSRDPAELHDLASQETAGRAALEAALEARLALVRSGLELSCVAGDRADEAPLEFELELELDGEIPSEIQQVGLEAESDRVTIEGGRLIVRLQLRPSEQTTGLARLDRVAVARSDPDRDRIRLPQPPGETLRIRALGVQLVGPGGAALPADGTPIPFASIELPAAPAPIEAGSKPRCGISHVRPRGVRAADADAELEERLRALGYL